MSSTWHWNHRNYYTTCSSLWTTKSSPCCWKILLRLQESYPHPLCWLAYHCANPSCGNVCHLAATCSGFVNPRGNVRARALFTRVWHCHLHSLTSVTSDPSLSPDNSPPRPTVPSLKSLLNQGLSPADTKNSKEKCAKCSAALRSNTVPVRCSVCSKGFHQKCSTGPKASTRDNHCKCEKCTNIQKNRTSESTNHQLPGSTNSLHSQPVPNI